jgi:hypothetical protein
VEAVPQLVPCYTRESQLLHRHAIGDRLIIM